MRARLAVISLGLSLALITAGFSVGCVDDDDDASGGNSPDAGAASGGGSDDPDAGDEGSDETDAGADTDQREEYCGDGIVQDDLNEICDDGNFFDDDGCDSLCELTCEDNADCDDGNPCNGEETCKADNTCELGEFVEDGTKCAARKTCFFGLCRDDVCGDTVTTEDLGEQCDDGNAVDDDGCTSECKFTCTTNDDCEASEPCSGATVCNTTTHTCGGDPLPDETPCTMKGGDTGWCFNEVCVPTDCGDGTRGGDEECDEGADNGKPGSGCSSDCKVVVCGNGKIEGDEQCDDNNEVNLDGCDENCQAEILFRFTRMDVVTGPAPEWCVYPEENQFGTAFPGRISIGLLGGLEIDVLNDIINTGMNAAFDNCSANQILQIRKLDDISFTRSDDEVELTAYEGEPEQGASCDPMPVDTGFYITGSNIGENNQPLESTEMIQRPGIIKTKFPTDLAAPEGSADARVGTLKDFMMMITVDTDKVSTPPGEMADWVKLPEEYGVNDEPDEVYHPKGIVCAAMDVTNMATAPVTAGEGGGTCCKAAGGSFDVCEEGDVPGVDCDALLSLFTEGCTLCVSPALQLDCNNCAYPFEVIRPTQPDVDTDGDGENDAYTLVVAMEGIRVESLGVKK